MSRFPWCLIQERGCNPRLLCPNRILQQASQKCFTAEICVLLILIFFVCVLQSILTTYWAQKRQISSSVTVLGDPCFSPCSWILNFLFSNMKQGGSSWNDQSIWWVLWGLLQVTAFVKQVNLSSTVALQSRIGRGWILSATVLGIAGALPRSPLQVSRTFWNVGFNPKHTYKFKSGYEYRVIGIRICA